MDAGEGRRGLRRRLLLQALLPAEHNNKTLTGNSRANWYIERGHLRRGIRLGTAHTFRNRIRQGPWIVETHGAVVRWLDFVRVRCNRKRPKRAVLTGMVFGQVSIKKSSGHIRRYEDRSQGALISSV
jgi:hypothetical protein